MNMDGKAGSVWKDDTVTCVNVVFEENHAH